VRSRSATFALVMSADVPAGSSDRCRLAMQMDLLDLRRVSHSRHQHTAPAQVHLFSVRSMLKENPTSVTLWVFSYLVDNESKSKHTSSGTNKQWHVGSQRLATPRSKAVMRPDIAQDRRDNSHAAFPKDPGAMLNHEILFREARA
jgi:hypothetical protein